MIGTEQVSSGQRGEPQAAPVRLGTPPPAKVQPRHQERLAAVYVRQSSPQQVLQHRESTALQYDLRRRAVEWGWPSERVVVIDEDQGHSAAIADSRAGFERLLAEVTLDHVGVVLGIEMSRLARTCKDWHQLLEVCALFGTLLADQDGLYDPRDYNDRLLLGLKGTLSEAELHLLRQRMYQGRLNKARRGELFSHPPIGYVRPPKGELALDPDEQVQAVVRLIFDQFNELGTINAVLRYLVEHQIRLPVRVHTGPHRGQLEWRRPNRQTLRFLLRHPVYAGAYTWGRRRVDPRRRIPGRPGTGLTLVPAEQCAVFIKDRCPAYITWQQYQANQSRMAQNRGRGWGAAGEGSSLVAGLIRCGRCGGRMVVQYGRREAGRQSDGCRPRYVCQQRSLQYGAPQCQSLSGAVVDRLVARQVMTVLAPAAVELSLSAARDIERERATVAEHWQQRVERARYESDRAARQYHAVEPEDRLVARELERRWEQKLLEQRALQEQFDRLTRQRPAALTEADQQVVRSLAQDIPALWHAAGTSMTDRRTVVRHLIEDITVTVPDKGQHVDVTILWSGGFTSHHGLIRPVARYDQLDNYDQLVRRILELRDQRHTAPQIAERLNAEGFRPPRRRTTFNAAMIRQLLSRRRRAERRPASMRSHQLAIDEWWLTDLARHLQMPQATMFSWIRRQWLHARQLPIAGGRWIIWADADEIQRLRDLKRCPRTRHNQPRDKELTVPKPRPCP